MRELDIAGNAVEEALSRITLIIDRSNCIDGVKSAMDTEDYEAAARYVSTYGQLREESKELEEGQVPPSPFSPPPLPLMELAEVPRGSLRRDGGVAEESFSGLENAGGAGAERGRWGSALLVWGNPMRV